jgi:hypothetical protein
MAKFVKLFVMCALLFSVSSCSANPYKFDEVYRYPCQDPKNWDTEDCQSPHCDVWGGCPDQILKDTRLYKEPEQRGLIPDLLEEVENEEEYEYSEEED